MFVHILAKLQKNIPRPLFFFNIFTKKKHGLITTRVGESIGAR